MSFAARLKVLRLRSGKSLQQLADDVGVSKPHLWDLETGKARNPTKEVLEKISTHFKVTVAELLGETDKDEGSGLGVMFRELRSLEPDDRELIEAMIQKLKEKQNKKST